MPLNDLADVRAKIEDSGQPFDPLARPTVDATLPLDEKPIGGLGIHLIRKLMDEVSYQRRDNKNHLVMGKHLTKDEPNDAEPNKK